ncbi:hypothetical protein N9M01_07365 [Luminiphilus sp.]|nr:hypothetical protein [Luminiphilus sp.]
MQRKEVAEITRPHLAFERPTSHYKRGEAITVVMLPSQGGEFDVMLAPRPKEWLQNLHVDNNRLTIKPVLPVGEFFLKARWKPEGEINWSEWSAPLRFSIHEANENLWPKWEAEHRLSLMLERSTMGAITLIDPEAEPPGAVGLVESKWFATPVYEGATPLVNEDPAYYQDPFAYYFDCIDRLIESGAKFVTWHDVLEGRHKKAPLEILLQFDVDGGPKSMRRLYEGLAPRNIRASLMMHRRGHQWYPYELCTEDLRWIIEAEQNGWAIGYHNNALSQVVGESVLSPDESTLREAAAIFADDVSALRRHFNIRTFTHHGGNVYNLKVVPPCWLDIIGVDRASSPRLWESIRTMFSDGGFVTRPGTLRSKVESLTPGLHFFRNHPFKYGNYTAPVDAPPRFTNELQKAGLKADQAVLDWQKRELEKEARWLRHRQASRSKVRLAYLRLDKPISSRFAPYSEVEQRVNALRKRRRETFLRLYPWAEGDPRVFWWRMLEAWAPKKGDLLNVGALPPDQKNEHTAFLSPDVVVRDMDIDASRLPDYQFDVCNAPISVTNRFSGTLLFGLPYFASPSAAISACARITTPGGVGLFGFVADTHPARGSVWHPESRHLWRKEQEPLSNIGLKANLWAFDKDCLAELFQDWSEYKAEFMGHYWFVVARKKKVKQ